ncbi:MAG: CRISPR-associated protein Csx16 [Gammaproteobacteria bacterium]|nr:MAG: CRISPR-associated protein Csx16 [Gammaproteobacteria bacterium]
MTTYFVSRHEGAKKWAETLDFNNIVLVSHFNVNIVNSGDIVLGTLPVHLAAEVCAKGASYFHLELNLPPEARGKELSSEDMVSYGAKLNQYKVTPHV